MDHLTLWSANQQPSACRKSGILVHEVEEEYLFERQPAESGYRINLTHEVLVDKLVLCVPFHTIVESFGDGKEFDELEKAVQCLVEGSDDRLPSG